MLLWRNKRRPNIQKYNDTLYVQHPAEMERFFSANLGQLKKFSCSAVTGIIPQKTGMRKVQKYFHVTCRDKRIWFYLDVTYCSMPGSLTVKWIFKNTREKIKACNLSEKQNGRNSLAKQVLFYLKTAKKISCLQTRSGLLLCPVFILQQATKKKKTSARDSSVWGA